MHPPLVIEDGETVTVIGRVVGHYLAYDSTEPLPLDDDGLPIIPETHRGPIFIELERGKQRFRVESA